MTTLAPVILFVYNRPEHTRQTLEALRANIGSSEITLFIYSDGLKTSATEKQRTNHDKVREIIRSQNWCKTTIIESETNLGLATSIIKGVTEITERYGKVIVLEDDIVTSPTFLQFMNQALDYYETEEKVISISAYMYPSEDIGRSFFIKGADCWGWATWKRGWNLFEKDGKKLLQKLESQNRTAEFDLDGTYGYTQMLRDQIAGKIDSWAIRWHASAFVNDKLVLYPNKSFVQNIGIDGSGTHSGTSTLWQVELNNTVPAFESIKIEEDNEGRELLKTFYTNLAKANSKKTMSITARIKRKINHLLAKF